MWEYYSIRLSLDFVGGKIDKLKWVVKFDGTEVVGINNILNYFGRLKYELVSFLPDGSSSADEFGGSIVTHYRATFKRPLAEE